MMHRSVPQYPPDFHSKLALVHEEYGEDYFAAKFPNAAELIRVGPGHVLFHRAVKVVRQLTMDEAVDFWRPKLARELIATTLRQYAKAGGEGAHPDSSEGERERYFAVLDAMDDAERRCDLPSVRRICEGLITTLPPELRHLS
jgi:hypothetical protein